jgi:hypothetical protein
MSMPRLHLLDLTLGIEHFLERRRVSKLVATMWIGPNPDTTVTPEALHPPARVRENRLSVDV